MQTTNHPTTHPTAHPPTDPPPVPSLPAHDKIKDARFPVPWVLGVLIVAVLYFGTQILGGILLTLIPVLFGVSPSTVSKWATDAPSAQFIYVVLVEVLTLAGLLFIMRGWHIAWRAIGLVRLRLRDIGYAVLAYPPYFVLNAAAAVAAAALLHVDLSQRQETGFESAVSPADLLMSFISLVILPPIVEEIVMRGFLFSSLKRNFKPVAAAVITSVIFAAAHLQFTANAPLLWTAAIDTFILSLVLCYMRYKTGSLWPGIFLHGFKNLLAFLVLFVFKF